MGNEDTRTYKIYREKRCEVKLDLLEVKEAKQTRLAVGTEDKVKLLAEKENVLERGQKPEEGRVWESGDSKRYKWIYVELKGETV